MDSIARIWLVATAAWDGGGPGGGRAPPGALPAGCPPALAPEDAGAPPPPARPGPALAAWLGALAAAHAGRELVLACELELVRAAADTALGIGGGTLAGASVTLDWPRDGGAPQLIGIDLDWRPPFRPEGRARFPGGPGVAGSARG